MTSFDFGQIKSHLDQKYIKSRTPLAGNNRNAKIMLDRIERGGPSEEQRLKLVEMLDPSITSQKEESIIRESYYI
jgi:hypothetical protein